MINDEGDDDECDEHVSDCSKVNMCHQIAKMVFGASLSE